MRRFAVFLLLLVLSACGDAAFIPFAQDAPQDTTKIKVLSVALRQMDETGALTGQRSPVSHFVANTISIPPNHKLGKIERPRGTPNPARHFTVTEHRPIENRSAFLKELRGELASVPKENREIILFVHGYNTTHTYATFRSAQLKHDYTVPGVVMAFSWPSAANPLAYSHDRDSVLFARDDLQRTIEMLHRHSGARIVLVGHSMGTFLIMETLRQIEIAKPGWTKRSLNGVALIAPDISVDVFKKQVEPIKSLPEPFVIFASRKDPALRLSSQINAVENRLGNATSIDALGDLHITFVDVTNFSRAGVDRHNVVGSSPGLISLLRQSFELGYSLDDDVSSFSGIASSSVSHMRKATQVIFRSPLPE